MVIFATISRFNPQITELPEQIDAYNTVFTTIDTLRSRIPDRERLDRSSSSTSHF